MLKNNDIIKCPIVTEKASLLKEKFNIYSMYIFVRANKRQIKSAIESTFDVKVSSLNSIRVKPKRRYFKGVFGYGKQKKKVYFSLINGQKLDIMSV